MLKIQFLWNIPSGPFSQSRSHIILYIEYDACIQRIVTNQVLLSLTSTPGRTLRILVADVIPWINKARLARYSTHAVCHATINPIFKSYMALLTSLPVIENYHIEVKSRSQTPSLRLRRRRCGSDCTQYIDDLLPYEPLCSYWACGQVFYNHKKVLKLLLEKQKCKN